MATSRFKKEVTADLKDASVGAGDTVKYTRQVPKLQSIGPVNISDLNDFLKESKIDFENLYKDKSISHLIIKDFKILKNLGAGSFGKVVLAELKSDQELYAIKVLDKKQVLKTNQFQYVHNEKRTLQALNFPFVINLKAFFVDNSFLYFVMPYVPGGNFYTFLQNHRPLAELNAKFYICQLVLALEYLHYLDLIHRDVKPENIMMDAFGYLKLADFGQCIRCDGSERAWTFTGTPEYMAPEIVEHKGYDCAVDWWALGVTLYEMCAGYRPFKNGNNDRLYKAITELNFKIPIFFSKRLSSLVNLLLVIIPKKRIANREKGVTEIKQHSWLKEISWNGILNRSLPAPYIPEL